MRQNLAIYLFDSTFISSFLSKKKHNDCNFRRLSRPILPYAILNAIQFCDVTDLNYCSTADLNHEIISIVNTVHNFLKLFELIFKSFWFCFCNKFYVDDAVS